MSRRRDHYLERMGEAIVRLDEALRKAGKQPDFVDDFTDLVEDAEGRSFRVVVVCDEDEGGTTSIKSGLRESRSWFEQSEATKVAVMAFAQAA